MGFVKRKHERTLGEIIGDTTKGIAFLLTATGAMYLTKEMNGIIHEMNDQQVYQRRPTNFIKEGVDTTERAIIGTIPYGLALMSFIAGYAGLKRITNREYQRHK